MERALLPVGSMPPMKPWTDPSADVYQTHRRDPLFQVATPLRRARVVVSEEILAEAHSSPQSRTALLLGLLHDDSIHLLRYADTGPPPSAKRKQSASVSGTEGWIEFDPLDDGFGVGSVTYVDGEMISSAGVAHKEAIDLLTAQGVSHYRSVDDPTARARADAVAMSVAEAAGADVFVTTRPIALEPPLNVVRGLGSLDVSAALPLVGLYLRRQGRHIVWRASDGTGTLRYNRGLFFLVAARTLLPSGWRWMSTCTHAAARSGEPILTWLPTALLQRAERALQARDHVHASLLVPHDNDTADDALGQLDVMLVCLMGAFDAAARVAHIACGLPTTDLRSAAWQRRRWRKELSPFAPQLTEYLADDTVSQHVLTVLKSLRNSVHGTGLQPLGIVNRFRGREATLVSFPPDERESLLSALEQLGGPAAWGVRDLIPDRSHADIRVLVERLLPACLNVLDELLRLTPVEKLNVDPALVTTRPPDDTNSPFAPIRRQLIQWQLGLQLNSGERSDGE